MRSVSLFGSFLVSSLLSSYVFACLDFPVSFGVAGSSFSGEEFQLRKTGNGAVFYNDGTEAYFNPVKKQWCMSPSTSTKETKTKENCISASAGSKPLTLNDSSGKVIGVFKISASGCLLLQSVRANGTADLNKPYLEICDQSLLDPYKGKMVVNLKGAGDSGYAEVNGPYGSVDANGWVSFMRTRSLGGDDSPSYDGAKPKSNIASINGKSMIKKPGCGMPDIENSTAAGAAGEISGGSH